MDLTSGSAIVTGGASGLGLATSRALADRGSRVVVVDLPVEGGGPRNALPDGAVFSPGDIISESDVATAVRTAESLGPIRVLVNCAGIGTPAKVLGSKGPHTLDLFTKVVTVNLVGTFNMIRLVAESMRRNDPTDGDRGVIVSTASVAAYDGQIGQAAYSASKSGIVGMTLPVARELADSQIRVMAVAPGTFKTPLLASLPEPAQESLAQQIPHPRRLGDPSEFADLIMHILDNGMLNGEVIRLDGAIRMAPR
ncbi:3-hydroxy-2-methylbutyryl-CoA dehydrogenase [Rhodococcus sp. SC4]|nr:3-hydroxy-2-methylbutyryl-CoA dehydrogenase [Rhodococcus sp. SC4]